MSTVNMGVDPPRSIVTDHKSDRDLTCSGGKADIICWTQAGGKPGQWMGPANDTKLGVHILPMAFP